MNKLGVTLSGGGARGLAHIGFLRVMDREKIHPAYVTGTSMGAIIGAAYATGMDVDSIQKAAIEFSRLRNIVRLMHISQPGKGFVDSEKIRAFLGDLIPEYLEFDQLKIPLAVCAVDLKTGMSVTLKSGKVLPAIMASSAMPGIFSPVKIGPYQFVDGGVLNNMPIDLAYQLGAEKVIAVDVQQTISNPEMELEDMEKSRRSTLPLPNYFYEVSRSEVIMSSKINDYNLQNYPPDLLIEMPISPEVSSLSGFRQVDEIIRFGEEKTESVLPQIRALLESGLTAAG